MEEYRDAKGSPCSLYTLCCTEPVWAKNRIEEQARRIEELEELLNEVHHTLTWARVFVTSKERAKQPEGVNLFDKTIRKLEPFVPKSTTEEP